MQPRRSVEKDVIEMEEKVKLQGDVILRSKIILGLQGRVPFGWLT